MLGEEIKKLRTSQELSQTDLADQLFCSRSLVSKWEQDKAIPSDQDLRKMASILKVSYDDLKSQTTPKDLIAFSFSTKHLLENVYFSLAYIFWPYFFLLLASMALELTLAYYLGSSIASNHEGYVTYFLWYGIVIVVLLVPIMFLAFETKKHAQGGVGLAYSRYELESVTISTAERKITVALTCSWYRNTNRVTDLDIAYVSKRLGYWVVGERRFRSAILPNKYLDERTILYLTSLRKTLKEAKQ